MRIVQPSTTWFCRDQARACALAEAIASGDRPTAGLINSGGFRNPPGFVYILGAAWRVSPHPLALQGFISGINVLAVLATFFMVRRHFGPGVAWWATAFLATSPWAIQYSRVIWAQDLLFPISLLTYMFLFEWLCRGKGAAAVGVLASLTVVIQVHLVGVVLLAAIGLALLWFRPKFPLKWAALACAIAFCTFLPYLLAGHLATPASSRLGYQHFWRVVPSALMSVTGLGWQLFFHDGIRPLIGWIGPRYWIYLGCMWMVAAGFCFAILPAARALWTDRRVLRRSYSSPETLVTALVVLIPLSFVLVGIRTSPTYLPLWYPLPFIVLGIGLERLFRLARDPRVRHAGCVLLVAILVAQLLFYAEQLSYIKAAGGVPGSPVGRNYKSLQADVEAMAASVDDEEVWLVVDEADWQQDEAAAYLLRRARWAPAKPGRAFVHFGSGGRPAELPRLTLQETGKERTIPAGAFLVRPWSDQRQGDGRIPALPVAPMSDTARSP
jgi:hypothetical protein